MLKDEELREKLAEYAHEAWSGWMKYMFDKTLPEKLYNGEVIPRDLVKRWQRQMNTPYAELSEEEKESDRLKADRMLEIVMRKVRDA